MPSTGVSATAELARRKTTILSKSPSPGLVQSRVTWVSPAVPLALVTLAGELLSMVMVALSVSDPDWVLVEVKAVTVPVMA